MREEKVKKVKREKNELKVTEGEKQVVKNKINKRYYMTKSGDNSGELLHMTMTTNREEDAQDTGEMKEWKIQIDDYLDEGEPTQRADGDAITPASAEEYLGEGESR